MATYTHVVLNLPEANRLLDLASVKRDVEIVQRCCLAVLHPESDDIFVEAMATAAFIRYRRCFDTDGVRKVVQKELLNRWKDDPRHKECTDLADTHYAHSINGFEMYAAQVWLQPQEKSPRGINNISVMASLVLHAPAMIHGMLERARAIDSWICGEMKHEQQKLKEFIEQNFSMDELYSQESRIVGLESLVNLRRPRRKPR